MREYEGGEESPRGGTDMNKRRLNYTLSLVVVLSFLLVLGLSGCSTLTSGEKDFSGLKGNDSTPQICGEEEFALTAGQTIDVGTVTVSNDEDYLYVTYNTTGDWYLTGVKLYVGLGDAPTERLNPGKAPYKSGDIFHARSYTFEVPLDEFVVTCDETTLWLQAHADVVRLDEEGNEVPDSGETAYGGDITKPKKGSWYGNISYTVQCCEEEQEPCYEWEYETAWGGNTEGGGKGWWYYFDPSKGSNQTIWAGQTINVGNVTVSGCSDGKATITITLTDGWELQDVDKDGKPVTEPVKIQGYDEIPDERPPAGKFETYKGNSPTVEVPCFNYYAIHLDVQLCE